MVWVDPETKINDAIVLKSLGKRAYEERRPTSSKNTAVAKEERKRKRKELKRQERKEREARNLQEEEVLEEDVEEGDIEDEQGVVPVIAGGNCSDDYEEEESDDA